MKLEDVTAEIRPRSDAEAVDLGFAMVRRDFWRCVAAWCLAMGPIGGLLGWLLWEFPGWFLFGFWLMKPAGSRMVLFLVSRRLFGERPGWWQILREVPRTWTRRFFMRFLWLRFSPWLPVTLAVEDLERLRGKMYRLRCRQISRRGGAQVMQLYAMGEFATVWLGFVLVLLVQLLLPEGRGDFFGAMEEAFDPKHPMVIGAGILWGMVAFLIPAIALTDVFLTGAGFGIYLNNRTWLEGWDVELSFRRLAKRLAGPLLGLVGVLFFVPPVDAGPPPDRLESARVMREIQQQPEFEVRKIQGKRPKWGEAKKAKPTKPSTRFPNLFYAWSSLGWLRWVFAISICGLLVGLIGWFLWENRHIFRKSGDRAETSAVLKKAKVVMGMEVVPESLPADVVAAARGFFADGDSRGALALLYRAAISHCIGRVHVGIRESDTEGDCVRRVVNAGEAAHPGYFQELTLMWMAVRYAGRDVAEDAFERMCGDWPYDERRML